MLPPEVEKGNIEYKRELVNLETDRINHLASQMKWRLNEGNGKAIYYIGIEDNGNFYGLAKNEIKKNIDSFKQICKIINANIENVQKNQIDNKYYLKINISDKNKDVNKYRIAFLGNSQSGKSTTINVLINNINDDGNGLARTSIFNHKHEILSGITSSISIRHLGINKNKIINNYCLDNSDITENLDKILYLIDFPGRIKYFKTICSKLQLLIPNFIFIVINPFKVDFNILKLYLNYCILSNITFNIIFTHQDINNFDKKIINILNFFKNKNIILEKFDKIYNKNLFYYINISNKTLFNLDKLKNLINYLTIDYFDVNNSEINIIKRYNHYKFGSVIAGLSVNNTFDKNTNLFYEIRGKWYNFKIDKIIKNNNICEKILKDDFFLLTCNYKTYFDKLLITNKYKFSNSLKFYINFISNKKINLEINKNILILIKNKFIDCKILEIKPHIIIKLNFTIIDNVKFIFFKYNNTYGLANII